MAGNFVGRRSAGSHNGISPDMIPEQTYNADAKPENCLDSINLNPSAGFNWIYTKPITSLTSFQYKEMMHISPGKQRHHESGKTRTDRDNDPVEHLAL